MLLSDYFARIGYDGPAEPTKEALYGVHRAHMASVAYENLSIHLGRENTLLEADFLRKIVSERRGGWCYEMNGSLQWALREMGFRVTRASAAVARALIGELAFDNHLIGFVDLDQRYMVDVGLGDGPSDPFPLAEGSWSEGPLDFRLEKTDDTWWRFHNHATGMAPSFDFTEEPRELPSFQEACTRLQTAEWSPFVTYAMVIRRTPTGFRALRDTIGIEASSGEKREEVVPSIDDYRGFLSELLETDLEPAAVRTLWDGATRRERQRAEANASS